jgi:hypothetical protein
MTVLGHVVDHSGLQANSDVEYLGNGVYRVFVDFIPTHELLAQQLHHSGLILFGYGKDKNRGWEVRFSVNVPRR